MQPPKILTGILAISLALLQGVPAPPAAVSVAGLVGVAGTTKGIAEAGKGFMGRHQRHKRHEHVRRMVATMEAELDRRAESRNPPAPPPGIDARKWDVCYREARATPHIKVGTHGKERSIKVEGLPAACVDVALAMGKQPGQPTVPAACGAGCVSYREMTSEYYETVRYVLNTRVLVLPSGGK